MDIWGWIVLYAVGLTLLQLLVYRFLLSGNGSPTRRRTVLTGEPPGEEQRSSSPSQDQQVPNPGRGGGTDGVRTSNDSAGLSSDGIGRSSGRGAATSRHVDTVDGRYCQHCGAENEPDTVFDRCWNCAGRL